MKKNIFFLVIIISVLIACSHRVETNVNKYTIPIDSITLAIYSNGVNVNKGDFVCYFQLIKGNNGYFYILYDDDSEYNYEDDLNRIGKSYMLLYQIFRDGVNPLFFNNTSDEIATMNFVKEFSILVENEKYLIEKYEVSADSINDKRLNVHYLSKEIGLVAIVNHRQLILAEHNSRINDSVMKKISERVVEEIEKTDTIFFYKKEKEQ